MVRPSVVAFGVGLIAGGVALVFSYDLRTLVGGIFLPEVASQTIFSVTPGVIESQAVSTLGSLAKYSTFIGAIIGNLVAYGLIGILEMHLYRRVSSKGGALNVAQLILVPYTIMLAIAMLLSVITEISSQPLMLQMVAAFLIPPHVAYGLILLYFFTMAKRKKPKVLHEEEKMQAQSAGTQAGSQKVSRREFIRMMGVLVGGSVATVLLFQWYSQLSNPGASRLGSRTGPPTSLNNTNSTSLASEPLGIQSMYASEVTPADEFYRVDINIVTPAVDVGMWNLMVSGLVDNPINLSYDDIKAMPSVERYHTLECVSNMVGGDYTSTGHWKGVLLKDVLDKAKVQSGATYVVFRCADGYDVGIPIERVDAAAFLAYELNDSPLPRDHGYPLRAIVPGLYGMMNAKWITSITLVAAEYEGFWQRRGWTNDARYKTHSTIVVPGNALSTRFGDLGVATTVSVGSKVPIAGIAYAGDRGISKVEVSTDGGNTWQAVSIKKPLSPTNTWVLWNTEWTPQAEGTYDLSVRAFDGNGAMQPMGFATPFPSGSSGYHTVSISAVKGSTS